MRVFQFECHFRYGGIRGSYQHFGGQGGQDSGFPSPRSALGYPFPPMHQNSYSGYHLGSYAPPCSSPPKDGKCHTISWACSFISPWRYRVKNWFKVLLPFSKLIVILVLVLVMIKLIYIEYWWESSWMKHRKSTAFFCFRLAIESHRILAGF